MIYFMKKCILGQKKLYLIMVFVLIFLSAIELYFTGMYSLFAALNVSGSMMIKSIATLITFLSLFLTLFINQYFIESKTAEFTIFFISGSSMKKTMQYILLQFGSLYLLSAFFCIPLGYLGLYVTSHYVELYLGIPVAISFLDLLGLFLVFLFTKLLYIFVLNIGFMYRVKGSIHAYMTNDYEAASSINYFSALSVPGKKKKFPIGKILSLVFLFVIIFVGFSILHQTPSSDSIMIGVFVILAAFVPLIQCIIPFVFQLFHDCYFMKKPIILLALSQLKESMHVIIAMVLLNTIFIPIFVSLFLIQNMSSLYFSMIIVCYIGLLVILLLGFYVRLHTYLPNKNNQLCTLWAIGYPTSSIKKIQYLELILFISLVFLFPLLLIGYVLMYAYSLHLISMNYLLILIGSYVFAYGLFSIYMCFSYQKQTKEVLHNVNYLNREQ